MKKFSFKSFVAGLLTMTLILGLAVGASAASVGKNITVYFNDIKLMVDGKQVTPRDASGNEVEPFIYNGTTYLPVRAVGEALGQDVNWDSNSKTVVVGEYDRGESLYPDVKLEDMNYLYKEGTFAQLSSSVKDNFGTSYNGYSYVDYGCVEFALNGQYDKFAGTIIQSGYDSNPEGEFVFIVDGKTVKTIDLIKAGESPVDFQIDVDGANRIKIVCESIYGADNSIVNAGFYK